MRIQYIIFTATVYFLVRSAFDLIWYSHDNRIVDNVIQSIVFAILFWWIMGIYIKRMYKKISKVDSYLGQKAISCGLMNHVRGIIADGGAGYLLPDKLVFVPHKLNFSWKEVNISFSEVESIKDYKNWNIFDTGLKITLKSGKIEKFVIDKTTPLYKMILDMIRKSSNVRQGGCPKSRNTTSFLQKQESPANR